MQNLWILIIPYLAVFVGFGIAAVIVLIKKPKQYVITSILLCLVAVACLVAGTYRYTADIFTKETTTFTGTYTSLETSGIWGTNTNFFDVEGSEMKVYIPKIYWSDYDLVEGEQYKVTYFNGSKVIYSIERM